MIELMKWEKFADWIKMNDDRKTVKLWIEQGIIPSVKIEETIFVNVGKLKKELYAQTL